MSGPGREREAGFTTSWGSPLPAKWDRGLSAVSPRMEASVAGLGAIGDAPGRQLLAHKA